ncbi:hypothetical protein WJX72_012288 [[Myrmecia] bisecta]|uniref:Uncharacterized protein n=1 Tax=[Myrmecia] bisecta TaxID=41462 RepID=A0AAW1RAE7_9CHLO
MASLTDAGGCLLSLLQGDLAQLCKLIRWVGLWTQNRKSLTGRSGAADEARIDLIDVRLGPSQQAYPCIRFKEVNGRGLAEEKELDICHMGKGWDDRESPPLEISMHGCGLPSGLAGLSDDSLSLSVHVQGHNIERKLFRMGPMASAVQGIDYLKAMFVRLPDNFTPTPALGLTLEAQLEHWCNFESDEEWAAYKANLDLLLGGETGFGTLESVYTSFDMDTAGLQIILTCPPGLFSNGDNAISLAKAQNFKRPLQWPGLRLADGRLCFDTRPGQPPGYLGDALHSRYQICHPDHPLHAKAIEPEHEAQWAGGKGMLRVFVAGEEVDFASGGLMGLEHSDPLPIFHPNQDITKAEIGWTVVAFAAPTLAERRRMKPTIRRGYGPMMFAKVHNPYLEIVGGPEMEVWIDQTGHYHTRDREMKLAYKYLKELAGGQLDFTDEEFLQSAFTLRKNTTGPHWVYDLYLRGICIETTLDKRCTGANNTKTDIDAPASHPGPGLEPEQRMLAGLLGMWICLNLRSQTAVHEHEQSTLSAQGMLHHTLPPVEQRAVSTSAAQWLALAPGGM